MGGNCTIFTWALNYCTLIVPLCSIFYWKTVQYPVILDGLTNRLWVVCAIYNKFLIEWVNAAQNRIVEYSVILDGYPSSKIYVLHCRTVHVLCDRLL